ncbi:MAG: hypothetical protein EPN85_10695 [Bacteroidetes bacterium]|nr:MAG: hypothetical protein EPN85_10695 [Bacteroidota bacterium]
MFRICFLGFLLIVFCASAQSKKEKKAIKTYAVKSITENVTESVSGKMVTRKDSYTAFDKNANITSNEEYRKDGTLKHKETAKYDSQGNKLEETVWDAAEITPNPEKYVKQVSKFDSEDSKTEQQEFDASGKLLSKTKYSYNNNGDKTLEEVFDVSGKLIRKFKYSYNSKGLKIDKLEYDGSNVLISSRRYQYEF